MFESKKTNEKLKKVLNNYYAMLYALIVII